MRNGNGIFYVYALIDPRNGEPFYIGKGRDGRCRAHEIGARAGERSAKACRIREIWAEGLTVGHTMLAEGMEEPDAYQFERQAITARRETLTNVSPGGGPCSVRPEKAQRDKAFRAECSRLVDDLAVPAILFDLACRDVLDLNDPQVQWSLKALHRGGISVIRWHREIIEVAP